MSNDELIIGTSNLDGKANRFGKSNFTYIKSNEPNVYRVLPPVKSLAATGEYFKYHAVHRNMRNTKGHQMSFVCPEDVDFKTKIIKRRCPVCDRRRELEAQRDEMVRSGATKEQLTEFKMVALDPLSVERSYYMNVTNLAGEIAVLPINSTLKKAMVEEFKKMKNVDGIDPTGILGVYFDFEKISAYKGDNKPVFNCRPYYESVIGTNGLPTKSYKTHEITKDFLEKMKTQVRDLTSLHRTISMEDMAALAKADHKSRPAIVEAVFDSAEVPTFNGSEDDDTLAPDIQPVAGIGGVSAVNHFAATPSGVKLESNNLGVGPTPAQLKEQLATKAVHEAEKATATEPSAQPSTATAAKVPKMTDEEFRKYFQPGG